jgi:hypothetical protein
MSTPSALRSEMYRQHKPIAVAYYNIHNQCTTLEYPIDNKYSKDRQGHLDNLIRELTNVVLPMIPPACRHLYVDKTDGLYCSFTLITPERGLVDGNFELVEHHDNRATRQIDATCIATPHPSAESSYEEKDLDIFSNAKTEAEAAAGKTASLLLMKIYHTLNPRTMAAKFGAWDRAEYERADDMPRHFHIISELQHYDMLDKDTVDVGTRGVDTMEEFMAMLSSEPSVVEAAFAGTPFICAHCTSLVFEKGLCYDHLQESQ